MLYKYLTDHGIAVVAPNYRMYPDARYPDFLVDSAKAVAWVFQNMQAYGTAMLIIVSDNDMENRYEQTMLLISTLKHFGHTENVSLKVMHGTHCAYVRTVDENGDSILGKLVLELIHK